MRPTWTAVALTAALGLTTVTATSANLAYAADTDTHTATATHTRPIAGSQPAGLPAVPDPAGSSDPARTIDALGSLLDVVNGIIATATSGNADPAALQKQIDDLKAAIQQLLSQLHVPPVLSDQSSAKPSVSGQQLSPEALANLKSHIDSLVAAAKAAKPDPGTIRHTFKYPTRHAVPPLSMAPLP